MSLSSTYGKLVFSEDKESKTQIATYRLHSKDYKI